MLEEGKAEEDVMKDIKVMKLVDKLNSEPIHP